ncbi:MAG: serine/threonine-protein kinase [Kofleriaceae bacterium]
MIGNYVLERELGRGGMGVVYAATHRVLGRPAAIKVLLTSTIEQRDRVERFFNEARAAMAIDHPGIVKTYDVGIDHGGRAYIAMELLDGGSLATRLRQGPLPLRLAVQFARQIADALAAAHRAGVVHRDLKPENIIVTAGEQLKLVDFGIAKLAQPATVRTATGVMMGTPLYMSPEQCEGAREVDARSDLYSLGCVMFAMLTGRPPFDGAGSGGVIGQHLHVAPPLLRTRCPAASAALEGIVRCLLAKSRDERFRTASIVATALSAPEVIALSGPSDVAATADLARPAWTPVTPQPMHATGYPPDPAARSQLPMPPPAPGKPRRRWSTTALVLGSCTATALAIFLPRACGSSDTTVRPPIVATVEPDARLMPDAMALVVVDAAVVAAADAAPDGARVFDDARGGRAKVRASTRTTATRTPTGPVEKVPEQQPEKAPENLPENLPEKEAGEGARAGRARRDPRASAVRQGRLLGRSERRGARSDRRRASRRPDAEHPRRRSRRAGRARQPRQPRARPRQRGAHASDQPARGAGCDQDLRCPHRSSDRRWGQPSRGGHVRAVTRRAGTGSGSEAVRR